MYAFGVNVASDCSPRLIPKRPVCDKVIGVPPYKSNSAELYTVPPSITKLPLTVKSLPAIIELLAKILVALIDGV